jgi:hypothetical protein
MNATASIEWTDRTWNPVRGCSVISPGCVTGSCPRACSFHRDDATPDSAEYGNRLVNRPPVRVALNLRADVQEYPTFVAEHVIDGVVEHGPVGKQILIADGAYPMVRAGRDGERSGYVAHVSSVEATIGASACVVARNETPWPPALVIAGERRSAAAFALHNRIWLVRQTKCLDLRAVPDRVVLSGRHNLDVLRAIVGLVAILVMDLLASFERPSEQFGRDETVLVDVAAHVGHWMPWSTDQHVAIRSDCASALPLGITGAGLTQVHNA